MSSPTFDMATLNIADSGEQSEHGEALAADTQSSESGMQVASSCTATDRGEAGTEPETNLPPPDSCTDIETAHVPRPVAPNLDNFTFQKLPDELKIKIYQTVIEQPRYVRLTLGYRHGTNNEYENKFPEHIKWWKDTEPRATYVPISENYASLLDVDTLAREETLKIWEKIENYPTSLDHPFDVYINYKTDIMVLTESGAWTGWGFRTFHRFTSVLPTRESEKIQRLVSPLPRRYNDIPYFRDIRQRLPNLKKLSFFYDYTCHTGAAPPVHECSCPFEAGNQTVLIDVSDNWSQARIEYPGFLKKCEEEKEANPEWKLEIRLVIMAKCVKRSDLPLTRLEDVPAEGHSVLNIGAVQDIDGDGIYRRCLTL